MQDHTPWKDLQWIRRTREILDSYQHWLKVPLIDRSGNDLQDSQTLWDAPFVVVAHGTEADPILNYGNRIALDLWEMDCDTFLNTPSRLTAQPVHRDERAAMLLRTARDGFIDDYQGIRISSTGRRFRIRQAIVWNVIDELGKPAGQAATFSEWEFLDG